VITWLITFVKNKLNERQELLAEENYEETVRALSAKNFQRELSIERLSVNSISTDEGVDDDEQN